jgi:hypothetical protein
MIKIYLPNINTGIHAHKGDSFRELVKQWEKLNLVEIIETSEPFIWWNNVGDILLYDRPTLEWLEKSPQKFNNALFGNNLLQRLNCYPWIFWARHPLNLENLEIVSYSKKQFTTVFIAKVENEIQSSFRNPNKWNKFIDFFDLIIEEPGKPYKYTNKEYIDLIRYSKFGLCLRGFGPKCHREVELMACGTIPIITPEVDIDNYYNPPIENIHYIRVSKPEDIPLKINTITQEKWEQMSKACVDWYQKNCSVQGSFNTTNEIIQNLNNKNQKIESISTLTNKNGIHDLTILLTSLVKFHKDIPVFIACDTIVKNHFENNNYGLTLYFDTCLDKYNDMNRQQMESKGLWLEFMLEKETVLRKAMKNNSNSLFLDADICLLDCLPNIDFSKDVILCRHYIQEQNEIKYGHFNGGYFFVNNIKFLDWFRTTSKTRSHFFEQQTLDYCHEEFKVGYFPIQNNFGWWRLYECDNPNERISKFSLQNGVILYDNKRLKSVHTHFSDESNSYNGNFNKFLMTFFEKTTEYDNILKVIKKTEEAPLLNLIIQSYNEKNTERMSELTFCILQNLENTSVKNVYNLFEGDDDNYLNKFIKSHPKYIGIKLSKRITYSDAFKFANDNLQKNSIIALLNLDIMLEEKFNNNELHKVLEKDVIIANSRHEMDISSGRVYLDTVFSKAFHSHSQDAWFFRTPIHIKPEVDVDFELGLLGCDNAIAHRLKMCDYKVYNMPERFKVIHVDNIRGKNSNNFKQFHNSQEDQKNIVKNKKPEKLGCALVPNYDAVKNISIDSLVKSINYDEEKRVLLISHILSESIKINNE